MKAIKFILIACLLSSYSSCADNKGNSKATFKVWGNCDMCKETIEGALKVEGVTGAYWNTETKQMQVSFDSTKINLDQIQQKIAQVGYDTEKYQADDNTYNKLHKCCQYERKK